MDEKTDLLPVVRVLTLEDPRGGFNTRADSVSYNFGNTEVWPYPEIDAWIRTQLGGIPLHYESEVGIQ